MLRTIRPPADVSGAVREIQKGNPGKRALPYFLLVAEALFFFRHVLFLPGYVIPWDLRGLHLPYTQLYAEALSRGEFPLWDPYTYCGRPLYATLQAGVFYPTNFLAAWLGSALGRERIDYLLEWSVVLHVALAGIFTFLLASALGLRRPAALCAATIFELSGFFAAHAEHLGTVIAASWMPLAWYAIVLWRARPGWRPPLLLAAAFALTILSGHTPIAAFVMGFSLLFAILLSGSWRLPLVAAGAAAFAIPLSAVELLPAWQLTNLSIAKFRLDYLKGGVPPQVFVSLLLPNHYHTFDPPHYNGPGDLSYLYIYCGLIGLAMAVAGIVLSRRHRLNRVFAILLACSAVAVLGDMTRPTHALYSLLPNRILIGLHPETAAAMLTLSLAMLAALAIDQLLPQRLAWLAAALIAAELILVSSGRPMNAMPFAQDPAWTAAVQSLRTLTGTSRPPSRIDAIHDSFDWAMTAPITRVYTASGADIMAPERVMQARLAFCHGERWGSYYEVTNLHSPVLGMMNIAYLLSRERLANPEPLVEAAALPGRFVYENRSVLPRFYLVSRVRRAGSMAEAASLVRSPEFHPAEEAIVEGEIPPLAGPPGTVQLVRYGLRDVELQIEAPSAQFLVTSETHYPGWRASVDGLPQPLYYTNVAFRGLVVPGGKHSVRMSFEPGILRSAAAISAMGWLAWVILWWRMPGALRQTG
jgi:hypothetical protein